MLGRELTGEFKATVEAARQQFCCVGRHMVSGEIFCKICFDQAVGFVGEILKDKIIKDEQRKDIKGLYEANPEKRRLILVLESPHKDEFGQDGKSLGPAHGVDALGTAYGIIHCLESIIGSLCDGFQERELILVNAVRFQCSQGLSLRGNGCGFNAKMKEYVVKELLSKEMFVGDFIKRLENVYRRDSDDVVVNAVGMNSFISCRVGRIIRRVTGVCGCGVGHPSAWPVSKGRAMQIAGELF